MELMKFQRVLNKLMNKIANMIVTILFLAVLIIAVIAVIKNTSLKKGKDFLSVYDNFFTYKFIGIVVVIVISFVIYLFKRPQ